MIPPKQRIYSPWSLIWIIPAIMLIVVSFFSYANVDSIRDYTEALRIANGEAFPLLGPQMAFTFSVGPWWFYVLSLVVYFESNWLMIAVFTAVLSGFKFLIAYRLGLLLANKTLGVIMVSSLLLFNMNLMQSITFTHTNLVETVMLLVLFINFRNQQNLTASWLILGVLCGLAFHVHPTAFLVGFFVFLSWCKASRKWRNACLFMIGLVVVFAPLLIYEFTGQENFLHGSSQYLEKKSHLPSLSDLLNLLMGFWIWAPFAMLKAVVGELLAWILILAQSIIQLLAWLTPLWMTASISKNLISLLKQLWLFFCLSVIGLLFIRSNTPWYLTYGLSLTSALITAIGLYILWQQVTWRKLVKSFVLWIFTGFSVVQIHILIQLNNNQIRVPSVALNDIKSLDTEISGLSYEIVAHQAHNHGAFTCQTTPVAVHGAYAQLLYSHNGIEHHSVCKGDLFYGPAAVQRHVLGLPHHFATYISENPVTQVGNTVFYLPIAIAQDQRVWKENFKHDYERKVVYKEDWQQNIVSKVEGEKHLVITNLLGFKMPWKVTHVKINGTLIEPTVANYYSALYVCHQCEGTSNQWEVVYQEGVEGMTNIVSF